MSINYNAIIGNRAKVTLPSSEGWKSTNSILRDPPKSITTRRIDHVDTDGSLNKLYAESGDRFSENINLYARGVNPFVAVQYSNTQYSGGQIGTSNGNGSIAAGKLPYRIMDGGAFRPPQLRQEQLLPLSRQPRNFTSMGSNPQFIDYTKTVMCDSQKTPVSFRQVKKPNMNVSTSATASKNQNIKVNVPGTKEHYININKHVVEDSNFTSASAKLSAKANLQIVNRENLREAKKQINNYTTATNKSENIHVSTAPDYIQERTRNLPEYGVVTQKSDINTYVQIEPDYVQERTRNIPEYNVITKKSDARTYVRIEPDNEYEFQQKVSGTAHTNMNSMGDYEINRDVILPQTLKYGGFDNFGIAPSRDRNVDYDTNYSTGKRDISRKIMEMRQ